MLSFGSGPPKQREVILIISQLTALFVGSNGTLRTSVDPHAQTHVLNVTAATLLGKFTGIMGGMSTCL